VLPHRSAVTTGAGIFRAAGRRPVDCGTGNAVTRGTWLGPEAEPKPYSLALTEYELILMRQFTPVVHTACTAKCPLNAANYHKVCMHGIPIRPQEGVQAFAGNDDAFHGLSEIATLERGATCPIANYLPFLCPADAQAINP
jgi:hypothetical protein